MEFFSSILFFLYSPKTTFSSPSEKESPKYLEQFQLIERRIYGRWLEFGRIIFAFKPDPSPPPHLICKCKYSVGQGLFHTEVGTESRVCVYLLPWLSHSRERKAYEWKSGIWNGESHPNPWTTQVVIGIGVGPYTWPEPDKPFPKSKGIKERNNGKHLSPWTRTICNVSLTLSPPFPSNYLLFIFHLILLVRQSGIGEIGLHGYQCMHVCRMHYGVDSYSY